MWQSAAGYTPQQCVPCGVKIMSKTLACSGHNFPRSLRRSHLCVDFVSTAKWTLPGIPFPGLLLGSTPIGTGPGFQKEGQVWFILPIEDLCWVSNWHVCKVKINQ